MVSRKRGPGIIQIRPFCYWSPWWLGDPPFQGTPIWGKDRRSAGNTVTESDLSPPASLGPANHRHPRAAAWCARHPRTLWGGDIHHLPAPVTDHWSKSFGAESCKWCVLLVYVGCKDDIYPIHPHSIHIWRLFANMNGWCFHNGLMYIYIVQYHGNAWYSFIMNMNDIIHFSLI